MLPVAIMAVVVPHNVAFMPAGVVVAAVAIAGPAPLKATADGYEQQE